MQKLRVNVCATPPDEYAPFVREATRDADNFQDAFTPERTSTVSSLPASYYRIVVARARASNLLRTGASDSEWGGSSFMCPRYTTGLTIRADPNDRALRPGSSLQMNHNYAARCLDNDEGAGETIGRGKTVFSSDVLHHRRRRRRRCLRVFRDVSPSRTLVTAHYTLCP